ncbi:hypothetical protein T12_5883, partial [Trichinella patagoniensis]
MDHLKVELGQFFQPAGNLSLRLPKVPQPLQGVVIRPGCELPTIQVWPEVSERLAYATTPGGPCSPCCDNTAPMASSLASTSTRKVRS